MFEQIMPNLFVFYPPNEGSNSYLLVGRRKVLIDSGLKRNGPLLKNALEVVGVRPAEIEMVLHTHGHCDHFSADYLFPKAEIAMHAFDAEYVKIKDAMFTASGLFDEKYYPKIKMPLSEGQLVDVQPFSLGVLETPGHTKGSICFHDRKNRLLFSGDTLFSSGFGRYDLQSSSKYDLIKSLARLAELDFELLLPGHGTISRGSQKENIKNALRALE